MRDSTSTTAPWLGVASWLCAVAAAPAGAASAPPVVDIVAGTTQKICQLTGEFDNERQQPTVNQTESKLGFVGTDLGIPVEHDGQLFLLFGDTAPRSDLVAGRGINGDALAVTDDTQADDCVTLGFLKAADGSFARATIPGVSLEGFEVPTGGFSANGKLYAFYTTDHTTQKPMGRSVLARSTDGAQTFAFVYSASTDRFINIAPVVVSNAAVPDVPSTENQGVLLFGSGNYRASSPSLAFVPLSAVEDRSAWRFFTGTQADTDTPNWSANESEARTLFDHPCVGEVSVTWNDYLHQWVMLYNCLNPFGIMLRTAQQPWGPWSDARLLFDPFNGGYCHFIHFVKDPPCDALADTPWGWSRVNEPGGPYGAYIIPRFTTGRGQETTVYFTMSTWNPYEAVLMRSTLRTPAFSCAALAPTGCRTPTAPGKSTFQLKANASPAKATLAWTWTTGAATALADFGDPIVGTAYALCVYDSTGTLVLTTSAPNGGTCAGKPCWKATKKGFTYANKALTPDGLFQLQLTSGVAGKAKLVARGKGANLAMPALPLMQNPTVVVQLQNSNGTCWEADYSTPAKQNDAGRFNDKSD